MDFSTSYDMEHFPADDDGILDDDGDLDLDDTDYLDVDTVIEEEGGGVTEEKVTYPEQVRMIHLRSHLNQLVEKVEGYRYSAEKTREEMKKCQSHIKELTSERDRVFREIQTNDSDNNMASLYRLRSAHERVCKELSAEEELERVIADRLEEAEYELAKVEVEHGKFILMEANLLEREGQLARDKVGHAQIRLRKEKTYARQAENARRTRERDQMEAIRAREERQEQALEEAKRSQERANKYLEITLDKLRTREKEEESRYHTDMQRKMEMLLKLKSDIASNRENLRALRARDQAREREETFLIQEERQRISREGGNPDEALLIKKRLNEFEKQKQQFESQQRENKSGIMNRILLEEERIRRRKQQQPQLWNDPQRDRDKMVAPHKKKPLKTFQEFTSSDILSTDAQDMTNSQLKTQVLAGGEDTEEEEDGVEGQDKFQEMDSSHKLHDSSDSEAGGSEDEDGTSLAKPEFEGLWDQHKPYKVPKEVESGVKLPGASKMDQEILSKVLQKQREGITIKQVAAGKEFTGCPFYSKPDVIHFKDFTVGSSYKKKVTLTNVSYTVNYCKFVGITERLKDFINIDFDPPGQMSAGLTCEMMVTFKPMINEDLEGEVNFLSQTGPFAIPLRCTTKKCDLQVDLKTVDFGTTVIGETLKRSITLTNKGALGTKFEFFKVTGMKQRTCTTAETSLGRLTTADTIRALTPDSMEFPDKPKSINLTDRGQESRKKLSVDEADKMAEGRPGTAPQAEGQLEVTVGETSVILGEINTDSDIKPELMEEGTGVESPEFGLSEMDEYGSLDGMRVGQVVSGEIGPFSSLKLDIVWQPTIPGKVNAEFLVTFTDPLSEGLSVSSVAMAMDVPVWVERQTVDLRICMFDRLYQDTVIVNNRATTALRVKFEVCKELRNHLELLPKTGYIQAQSQFSAQLKFLPRKSLFEEAGKYFDKETGVLEAPMIIRVADQTQPVPFTVTAVVTNSDMQFDVTNIDFGYCTIYESVKTAIKLTNKSILPQPFGFVGHPDYVEVQPNDGFGTLLPLETIELHVIFSPPKAKDYKFELCCKSLINREFRIQCKGVGVHPPLEMSEQVVHFSATSLYDVSTASVHVVNSHTSSNEFTHPVPRIGKGEIAPVGPTSFEFVLPEDSPLTISPTVGTVDPGKKCCVQVRFSPKLKESDIRREAVRMATRMMEAEAEKEYRETLRREQEAQEQAQKAAAAAKKPKGKSSPKPNAKGKSPGGQTGSSGSQVHKPRTVTPPDPDTINKDSAAYAAAIGSLLRQYKGGFKTYVVPCYVASGKCGNPGELPYSIHNTLYLEVNCPVVKPPVVVISDSGKTTLDFGEVSIGQHMTRSVTIQNISDHSVELDASLLDTTGPFQNLNALRMLKPGGTHTAVISFTPNAGRVFHEVLEIHSPTATLYLTLTGRGVSPIVNLSVEGNLLEMGSVLSGEYVEKTFKIHNTSSLSIDYMIKLDSLSLLRHSKSQLIPSFVERDKSHKVFVGMQNFSGQNVFDLVPSEGTIEAGATKEIMVTFAPDHASDNFSDGVRIELFNKEETHFFQLSGIAKDHIMYVEGGDTLVPGVESLSLVPKPADEDDGSESRAPPTPVLLTLCSVLREDQYTTASRDLHVGCVRTMAVSQKKEGKKNGEFQVDNLGSLQAKGFNIDPLKGMIEAGSRKAITVTWTPPQGYDPSEPSDGIVMITLKGDVTEQFKVILKAMVVTE